MLDERLEAVASFVSRGCRAADIGTDHGYLAMELYRRDSSRRIIAADKNSGPCEAARKTLAAAGLEELIEVRQGDGLGALVPGEADTVCIAGMGGRLIADILAGQPEVFRELQRAVLQPQGGAEILRRWLYKHGWHIADEALAQVDGRIYQIILAQPGREQLPSRLELQLGPVLLQKRGTLFAAHAGDHAAACRKVLAGLQRSSCPDASRLEQLKREIAELEALSR